MKKTGIWILIMLLTAFAFGQEKQKIILDTDLGDDIDDAFAMVQALSSDKFEILGICMGYANTVDRSRIALKMLYQAGLDTVPIYVGRKTSNSPTVQSVWAEDFYLLQPQEQPAAEFIVETLNTYPGEVVLFTVGPVTNMKDVVELDPDALSKAKHIYSMFGAFVDQSITEWNVVADIPASQAFTTHTNNNISFSGIEVASVQWRKDKVNEMDTINTPLTVAVLDLRDIWDQNTPWRNPTLFDNTALAMFMWPDLFETRNVYMYVDDAGHTIVDEDEEPNCEIAVSIDEDEFSKRLMELYWAQNYRRESYICLSTIIEGGGKVSPRRGTFEQYAAVELTATENEDWVFTGWSGDVASTDSIIMVPMDSDKLIKATFTRDITPKLVAWWKFDEGSGLVVADESGEGNDGSLTAEADWVEGKTNKAIYFHVAAINMQTEKGGEFSNEEFTVSMWVNWPEGMQSGWNAYMEFNRGTWDASWWGLMSNGSTFSFVRGNSLNVNLSIEADKWYNLAVTLDKQGVHKIYLDGELIAEELLDPLVIDEAYLTVGANNGDNGNGSGAYESSNATLDEIRYYNVALNQSEIQNIMNPGTNWTLTTEVMGSGIIELSPSASNYADGTTVELKAIPDEGWRFTGWSDGLGGTKNPTEITMYLNKNITATFELDSTISINGFEASVNAFSVYPNPCSDYTTITYELNQTSDVYLSIYNAKGEEINVLVNKRQQPGTYIYRWNVNDSLGANISNGIYFCKLQTGIFSKLIKLAAIK